MQRHYSIYLRTYRKKFGLTQHEVAELVGMDTGQIVSRHEGQTRIPNFKAAIAYQIVFDVPLRALFPELYKEVEREVLERACALRDRIEQEKEVERPGSDQRRAYKFACINDVIARIEAPEEI